MDAALNSSPGGGSAGDVVTPASRPMTSPSTTRPERLSETSSRRKDTSQVELKKQQEKYSTNPAVKIRKRSYYQKNKAHLSKVAREKARKKKADSDANMAKYEKSIRFGPEFVCICCHRCMFEDQVFVFTEKRKEKIGADLLKSSCKTQAFEVS